MPSPVGHALAGVALGCLVAGRTGDTKAPGTQPVTFAHNLRTDQQLLVFACLGMLSDIDFLLGIHSMHTHSIGAIAVVVLIAFVWDRRWQARTALAAALAYGSHVLLDWLGSDSVSPIGIMALWPLTSDFYLSDGYWFMSICRQYSLASCWLHNGVAVLRELVVLGTAAALSVWLRFRSIRRTSH